MRRPAGRRSAGWPWSASDPPAKWPWAARYERTGARASSHSYDARGVRRGQPRGMPTTSVPRFSYAARFARRQRLKGSLWVVPLLCALAGPLLAELVIAVDARVATPSAWSYSDATAGTVLSAIVGAMVGLTGFVVAFGVLVVQMATQTLSPRFMRLWYRDGLQKAVLGTFVGTLTYALALLRAVGPESVPNIGVTT